LYALLISPMHATCPVHLILLDLITQISGEGHHYVVFSSLLQLPPS
jgi:hypothetical protein